MNGIIRFAASALRRIRGRSLSLDLESTSEYMKKDLGLLDGRMARQDDDMLVVCVKFCKIGRSCVLVMRLDGVRVSCALAGRP
ncbi:hypothetical protein, partial [Sinorhizobium meliloti]|uniref:hypothetical protein n=1 Tax=Rhizobium meliloti TaxID=382 RepID=UPI001F46C45F